ncbi:MAG TPA: ion channel, partial [Candidatus Eisenbacteria bacterium]|nr:ion channel [Candidatus Eisenbacteria bacterium]
MQDLGRAYLRRRYTILFYTLVLTMVASPVIAGIGWRGALIESLLAVNLLAAVMPFNTGKRREYLLVAMAALWIARPVTVWLGHPTMSKLTLAVWTLVGLLAAASALRFAMSGIRIEAEHLFAALSAYLLSGVYFGLLYWAIEELHPGTFAPPNFSRTGAIYFSFVTLATLGYGDIVPRSDLARGLAVVEGVGGQLFLAVLVARLLSLYSSPT